MISIVIPATRININAYIAESNHNLNGKQWFALIWFQLLFQGAVAAIKYNVAVIFKTTAVWLKGWLFLVFTSDHMNNFWVMQRVEALSVHKYEFLKEYHEI